jgi:hypothetical protein
VPWKRGDRGIIPPPHGESITRERRGRIALASSSALPSREEGRAYRKEGGCARRERCLLQTEALSSRRYGCEKWRRHW